MRVPSHPILGPMRKGKVVTISVDGVGLEAFEGEPLAAALWANGIIVFRNSPRRKEPRGVFCAIGQCHDCMVTVDGISNIRACVTRVKEGMQITTRSD